MNSFILLLSGPRRVGKDTLFQALLSLDRKFVQYSFAKKLKDDLAPFIWEHFKINVWNCSEAEKELIRPLFISYGWAKREVNIDHWVEEIVVQIKNDRNGPFLPKNFCGVISDLRFVSEKKCLEKHFGRENIRQINLTRIGAPPPTAEEEKHYRKVAAMADYTLQWGFDSEEDRMKRAKEVIGWLNL